MGAQLRAVRQRIRSIQSTAKITRAQELIAASRIVRAQQRVRAAEPYSRELLQAVEAVVSRSGPVDHPLVREPEHSSCAAILILTSDRGFCGGFNANVLREAQALRARLGERGIRTVTYVAGTKGIAWHRFRSLDVAGAWSGFSDSPEYRNAADITAALLGAFGRDVAMDNPGRVRAAVAEGSEAPAQLLPGGSTADGTAAGPKVDEIHVVRTEFVSMLTQRPVVNRILPLEVEETDEPPPAGPIPLYEFEPSPQDVLDALLPWYVENRIYHGLLESAAAEIAARRRAMKSATDNANDLLEQFTREANKARQAEITQEISEIVGGANALAESLAGSE